MTKQWKNIQKQIFFITVFTLLVGLINITFTLVGLSCFILPFYFYFKYKDKIWCKYICPRSGFFLRVVSKVNLGLQQPKWLTSKRTRYIVLIYFLSFMSFAVISTVLVGLNLKPLNEQVSFLVIFKLPNFPQLINLAVPDWVTQLSYSIYSMLFTSTVVGVILGILYKPKIWCAICPVNTMTPIKKKS